MLVQAGVSCQWTTDSQRLILEYFDMINISPSHIYHSALQFSPSSSWLHQYYSTELSQEIKVIKGISFEWGPCFRTVLWKSDLVALVCWKDTIAVGSRSTHTIILDVTTGSQIAVLSGHTGWVKSLAFSPDGTLLVSGSFDKTIKLWDLQTGGFIKTFQGHTGPIHSISISANGTLIASGSEDETIRLWDIQVGECYHIIQQENYVDYVCFSPLDPQYLISISDSKLWQWTIDGHQIVPTYDGSHTAFSSDGTQFALCNGPVVQIQSSDSRAVVAEFHIAKRNAKYCCFSPDGKLVAVSSSHTAYVWDITNSDPCLIETLTCHASTITSLAFSSPTTLISTSYDKSVRFWQIDTSSKTPDITDPIPTPLTSPIKSITLQAKDGIAISSDTDGVVRIWSLLTGLCKASFQTPAKGSCQRDIKLVDGRLILVWYATGKIHIWDTEKGEFVQRIDVPEISVNDLRISGDGSKVFCLDWLSIHTWSIYKGEAMGEVKLRLPLPMGSFMTIDGSRVWVQHDKGGTEGWDFGAPDSFSIKQCTQSPSRPHLDFVGGVRKRKSFLPGIEDTITGKEVFRLPGRCVRPADAQWDGQYLVAGYDSGEVLILECNCILHH